MKTYNKLVRDRIPEVISGEGRVPVVRVAAKEEMVGLLAAKLIEEGNEFFEKPGEEELADIMEVLETLIGVCGYSVEQIRQIKTRKAEERGGFSRRIVLLATKERDELEQ